MKTKSRIIWEMFRKDNLSLSWYVKKDRVQIISHRFIDVKPEDFTGLPIDESLILCPVCKNPDGKVWIDYTDNEGQWIDCDACYGTGRRRKGLPIL